MTNKCWCSYITREDMDRMHDGAVKSILWMERRRKWYEFKRKLKGFFLG